jgi:hypothetical protein
MAYFKITNGWEGSNLIGAYNKHIKGYTAFISQCFNGDVVVEIYTGEWEHYKFFNLPESDKPKPWKSYRFRAVRFNDPFRAAMEWVNRRFELPPMTYTEVEEYCGKRGIPFDGNWRYGYKAKPQNYKEPTDW